MQHSAIHVSNQLGNAKLRRLLKYIGITLLVNLLLSRLCSSLLSSISSALYRLLASRSYLLAFIPSLLSDVILCIIKGLLYRRFVFKSKNSAAPAILVLILLEVVVFILLMTVSAFLAQSVSSVLDQYTITRFLSLALSLGAFIFGYVIQSSRLYLEASNTAVVRSKQTDNSSDGDPDILGIELEDIEKRKAPKGKRRHGLFNRFDVESDNERVIAQSSLEAIRVMEHKELGIQHEWNCDDQNASAAPAAPAKPVIAPGNHAAIHVTEHSRLDMQHEWNCSDK